MSKKYRLLNEATSGDLSYEVSKHLKEGWQLYGSPVVTAAANDNYIDFHYSQALVREVKEEKDIKEYDPLSLLKEANDGLDAAIDYVVEGLSATATDIDPCVLIRQLRAIWGKIDSLIN
jgi:hypothetical protein